MINKYSHAPIYDLCHTLGTLKFIWNLKKFDTFKIQIVQ